MNFFFSEVHSTNVCLRLSFLFCPALFYTPISQGGYNVIKSRQGKSMCVSLATAYEGVYLDTYNLEVDVNPPLRIIRHNIPPFIPLHSLAEQSNMKTDIKVFLDALSQLLNAYAGRKQQLKLVKVPCFVSSCFLIIVAFV